MSFELGSIQMDLNHTVQYGELSDLYSPLWDRVELVVCRCLSRDYPARAQSMSAVAAELYSYRNNPVIHTLNKVRQLTPNKWHGNRDLARVIRCIMRRGTQKEKLEVQQRLNSYRIPPFLIATPPSSPSFNGETPCTVLQSPLKKKGKPSTLPAPTQTFEGHQAKKPKTRPSSTDNQQPAEDLVLDLQAVLADFPFPTE